MSTAAPHRHNQLQEHTDGTGQPIVIHQQLTTIGNTALVAMKLTCQNPELAARMQRMNDVQVQKDWSIYISHPSFDDDESAEKLIQKEKELADNSLSHKRRKSRKAPKDLPPYIASLFVTPLLTREQEQHLFLAMNFAKHKTCRAMEALAHQTETQEAQRLMESAEKTYAEAVSFRNTILNANLRLVVSVVKRFGLCGDEFFEKVSDGNMHLLRAIRKFDVSLGNKFSTYATLSIKNNFGGEYTHEIRRRSSQIQFAEGVRADSIQGRDISTDAEYRSVRLRELLLGVIRSNMDIRAQKILIQRYGLDGEPEQTLQAVGRKLKLTKEGVRKIQLGAEGRLRQLLEDMEIPGM